MINIKLNFNLNVIILKIFMIIKRYIFNISKIILILFFVSCEDNDYATDFNSTKELKTETIFIQQNVSGVLEQRPVIIQTELNINTNKLYPIVFGLHGNGGTNTGFLNRLKRFTDNGEFVGIYPQGIQRSWNLGSEASRADDVQFINLIIEELKNYQNLDMNMVYVIGNSNGSGMANKLGVETNHFKAIAPIVSQLMESMPLKPTTQPLSVFQVNGALDPIIPISGGPGPGTHIFLDALESAKLWANKFNCFEPQIRMIGEDTLYEFKNCDDGKEVRYLRIENGEHNVLNSPFLINEIWNFFQRF